MKNIVVIQKDSTRYVMFESHYKSEEIFVESRYASEFGETVRHEYVSRKKANELYVEMINKGFKRFRNIHEVSWYATRKNNTPFEEKWKTEGIWFIPIKSRVLK